MSNVTLSIGGRDFTVACADGEEGHVSGLGRMIDGKLTAMGDFASQSEPRMLLFAALLLADELHDTKSATPSPAPEAVPNSDRPTLPDGAARQLETIATRLENLAARLEGQGGSA